MDPAIAPRLLLSQFAIAEARRRISLGNIETAGRNRGPHPDAYARGVGLDPILGAYPWCTSGLYNVFRVAAMDGGYKNPFPRTAKAVRVWELLADVCHDSNPAPGRIYILSHGKPGDLLRQWQSDRYTSDGHIGLVTAMDANDVPSEISGNTFRTRGSREGNCWAEHHGSPEVTHGGELLGYCDVDRIATLLLAA